MRNNLYVLTFLLLTNRFAHADLNDDVGEDALWAYHHLFDVDVHKSFSVLETEADIFSPQYSEQILSIFHQRNISKHIGIWAQADANGSYNNGKNTYLFNGNNITVGVQYKLSTTLPLTWINLSYRFQNVYHPIMYKDGNLYWNDNRVRLNISYSILKSGNWWIRTFIDNNYYTKNGVINAAWFNILANTTHPIINPYIRADTYMLHYQSKRNFWLNN